jgi:hypothetical protein
MQDLNKTPSRQLEKGLSVPKKNDDCALRRGKRKKLRKENWKTK